MWLHVSRSFLGNEKQFTPKVPNSAWAQKENVTIPRICVAKTVTKCLQGIAGSTSFKDEFLIRGQLEKIYLYQLDDQIDVVSADGKIPDFKITGEHWVLHPANFKFVRKIDAEEFTKLK